MVEIIPTAKFTDLEMKCYAKTMNMNVDDVSPYQYSSTARDYRSWLKRRIDRVYDSRSICIRDYASVALMVADAFDIY